MNLPIRGIIGPGLGDVPGGPWIDLNVRAAQTVGFADMYWPNYKVAIQPLSANNVSPSNVGEASFFDQSVDWLEDNSSIVYTAAGALALFAVLDAVG